MGQAHPLFEWLETSASLAQMRWFLTQEAGSEVGFDDLVAYAQGKLPPQEKLECARNFWDEMGDGKQSAMHGQMLDRTVAEMNLQPAIVLMRLLCGQRCFDRYHLEFKKPGRAAVPQISPGALSRLLTD